MTSPSDAPKRAVLPPEVDEVFKAFVDGKISAPIAVLRLMGGFPDTRGLSRAVEWARAALTLDPGQALAAERLETLLTFMAWHRAGIDRMKALHRRFEATTEAGPVIPLTRLTAAYDEAYADDDAAPSANYTFFDAGLSARSTEEVVTYLRSMGTLTSETCLLDLGAGPGRFIRHLAPLVHRYVAVDVSMIALEHARRAAGSLRNVEIQQVTGTSLSGVGSATCDLALAIDMWPHLVDAGPQVEQSMFEEVTRVLAPAGRLIVMNYHFDGQFERHEARLRELSADRFALLVNAAQPFSLWDGVVWTLEKVQPAAPAPLPRMEP